MVGRKGYYKVIKYFNDSIIFFWCFAKIIACVKERLE